MAHNNRAPKQWSLSKNETVNSFENWKQNLIYTLSLDENFTTYLTASWAKKTKANPQRDFVDDDENVAENKRLTAVQKSTRLDLMLGQIANFCPIISRNTIVKNSTSLENIWQTIRLHFGFQSSGAHFLDFNDIKLQADEKPEDLYQRLVAFVDDNLLKRDGGISHHGDNITDDEELTPTLENFVVLTWLRLIHNDLPRLVKQRYGTELRSRSLASIKPEISQALSSLLEEIRSGEEARAMRSTATRPLRGTNIRARQQHAPPKRSCPLCKQAGRNDSHFLSECRFLPDSDRRYMIKARQIAGILEEDECLSDVSPDTEEQPSPSLSQREENVVSTCRVAVRQSPYLDTFYHHHHVRLTLDSGATGNMMRQSTAARLGIKVNRTTQSAKQADGSSHLNVLGEVRLTFTRNSKSFSFEGLVVENLDVDVLAGIPFMETNDIAIRPAKRQILIGDSVCSYGGDIYSQSEHSIRRTHVLRATDSTTVWPGDYIELEIPEGESDSSYAIEPHSLKSKHVWLQPNIVHSVARKIRVPNLTSEPYIVRRNDHICQVRSVYTPDIVTSTSSTESTQNFSSTSTTNSAYVDIDPDSILPEKIRNDFVRVTCEYDEVFSTNITGYNGQAGHFEAKVNMGPVLPPQRKGRVPQYSRNQLEELQRQFNDLEQQGVFKTPDELGITVEYLNPSFLVKKSNGGFRLVTAFSDVGRYAKPQPSLLPDVDSILRRIAQWKYLIVTDLTKAFYQIPLSPDSLKFCGVVTPFRGVRVYTRSAMGMPGSETALEELTCRVYGDLLEEGVIAKLADDLYIGGNSPEELLHNWTRVLEDSNRCNIKLSATKTVIAPKSTTILGWIWESGTLRASPHRVATLSSCSPPTSVKGMRSFIGAVKVLARVIPGCAALLAPLDNAIAGKDSITSIVWDDELLHAFSAIQKAVASHKTIYLPRPDDQLWIVTDGALKSPGIGATLYVTRNNKLLVAGYFSAKLRGNQRFWIPCEIEALSIATASRHFSPYIIQSAHKTCVLTDSRPCVMAFEKLCRGEFSSSPRVTTFLSVVSRYQLSVRHVAGAAILPSDFASRNAQECNTPTCQICTFVSHIEESVVRSVTAQDIISGHTPFPFTNKSSWLSIQAECPDLRRTRAHLLQGTRPSKKVTNIKDIKRYLKVATVAPGGLLVVKRDVPFERSRNCTIIPRQVLHGFLTSLHIKLSHPSANQLKTVVGRYFFALDMDKAIDDVTSACHQCASLKKQPKLCIEQSTLDPPECVGINFAADVMRRERQFILVVRECVTSYTAACIIEDERSDTLRNALLMLCISMRPLDGPFAVVRTDPAPGFQALTNDELLRSNRLAVEIGRIKNINKNPIGEKAIQELREELLRIDPMCRTVSPINLCIAVASLNSRVRARGLSSREMLFQRDQFTNAQLPVKDRDLIMDQHSARNVNHVHSMASKCPSKCLPKVPNLCVGDLVYLTADRNKSRARDRYLVVSVEPPWCSVRKFTGSQLRNTSYRVKISDCYKVPELLEPHSYSQSDADDSCEEDDCVTLPSQYVREPEFSLKATDTPLSSFTESHPPEGPPETPSEISDPFNNDSVKATGASDVQLPALSRPSRTRRLPIRFSDYDMSFS